MCGMPILSFSELNAEQMAFTMASVSFMKISEEQLGSFGLSRSPSG